MSSRSGAASRACLAQRVPADVISSRHSSCVILAKARPRRIAALATGMTRVPPTHKACLSEGQRPAQRRCSTSSQYAANTHGADVQTYRTARHPCSTCPPQSRRAVRPRAARGPRTAACHNAASAGRRPQPPPPQWPTDQSHTDARGRPKSTARSRT